MYAFVHFKKNIMDINFHYFTIKTLAIQAGFDDTDAQTIASYSQFVDDFDMYSYMFIDNVPSFARYLSKKVPTQNYYLFDPVTTGFRSSLDTARLALKRAQERTLIPFHFIPENNLKDTALPYITVPAKLSESSLVSDMLNKAKDAFLIDKNNIGCMKIGTLLHIFADTYAHQNYSGYHGWFNKSVLTKATSNIDSTDVTGSLYPDLCKILYAVGHAQISHAPDETYISFEMKMSKSKNEKKPSQYTGSYKRSNTEEFLIPSKEIVNYLLSCNGKSAISEIDWNSLQAKLIQAFKTKEHDKDKLSVHWKSVFPDISYNYSRAAQLEANFEISKENKGECLSIEENFNYSDGAGAVEKATMPNIVTSKSDDFFHFNVIADEIRKNVQGIMEY